MSLSDEDKKILGSIIQNKEELLNCDFKQEYHKCNDFIKDFLSLANANIKGDCYIIYGLCDNGAINPSFNIDNSVRYKLKRMLRFINVLPDYDFFEYEENGKKLDILKISSRYDIPYISTNAEDNKCQYTGTSNEAPCRCKNEPARVMHMIFSREYHKIGKEKIYGAKNKALERGEIVQMWRRYFNLNSPPQEMFVRYVMDFENWHVKEIKGNYNVEEANEALAQQKELIEAQRLELVYILDTDYKIEISISEVRKYDFHTQKLNDIKKDLLDRKINALGGLKFAQYKIFYRGYDLNKYFAYFNIWETCKLLEVQKNQFTPLPVTNTNKIYEYKFNDCRNFGEKLIHSLFVEKDDNSLFFHILGHMVCYHLSCFPTNEDYNEHIKAIWSRQKNVEILPTDNSL